MNNRFLMPINDQLIYYSERSIVAKSDDTGKCWFIVDHRVFAIQNDLSGRGGCELNRHRGKYDEKLKYVVVFIQNNILFDFAFACVRRNYDDRAG